MTDEWNRIQAGLLAEADIARDAACDVLDAARAGDPTTQILAVIVACPDAKGVHSAISWSWRCAAANPAQDKALKRQLAEMILESISARQQVEHEREIAEAN